MTDAASTPTPGPLHQALDWTRQQAAGLLHALSSIQLSRPVAEIAPVLEAAFEAALPAALAAGERSVAESLTAEHFQGIATLVGEVNAAIVQQYLARVASRTPATSSNPS